MPQKKKNAKDFSKLRQKAEEALKMLSGYYESPVEFSPDEMKTLIHDLDVHQIELEMQNDELKKSQAELEIERSRYFDFYNMAPVGFFSMNEQELIIECNLTATKMLGKTRADIINQPVTRFIIKEDQDVYYLYNRQFFETNIPQGCDLRMLKNDGSALWVHLEKTVVQKDDGNLVIRMVTSDITERKRVEEALAKNAERLKLATRAAGLGIWDWDIQKNQLIWNDRMYELYGVHKEDFSGAYEAWLAGIHPDDRESSDRISEKVRKGDGNYETEFRVLWPNGTVRVLKAYGQVIWNSSNNPVRMIGVNYDITVQRQTEKDLQESERKFKSIFNDANDGILLADVATKKFVMANNVICKMLGYTKEEILNLSIYDIHPEEELQFVIEGFKRQTRKEIRLVESLPVKRKDGTIFYADINSSPISIGADKLLVGIFRDITNRKDAYEQLKNINTALDVLLKKRNTDVQELEDNIFSNYELMIKPFLNKLKNSALNDNQQNLIEILDLNLNEIVSPFTKKLSGSMMHLTSTELQISSMIKQGFSNKEIAQMLYCSKRTIDSHRENIRKKLKLKNKKINLKTFLSNL